eukprot:gene13822-biopygen2025
MQRTTNQPVPARSNCVSSSALCYARVGGVSDTELNQLERSFLALSGWRLYSSPRPRSSPGKEVQVKWQQLRNRDWVAHDWLCLIRNAPH